GCRAFHEILLLILEPRRPRGTGGTVGEWMKGNLNAGTPPGWPHRDSKGQDTAGGAAFPSRVARVYADARSNTHEDPDWASPAGDPSGSVAGSTIRTWQPLPGWTSASTRPPCSAATRAARARPSPNGAFWVPANGCVSHVSCWGLAPAPSSLTV